MKTKSLWLALLVLSLVLAACGGGAQPATIDANAVATQVAAQVLATVNAAKPPATSAPVATQPPAPAATQTPIAPPPPATQASNTSGASFSPIVFALGENNEDPVDPLDSFPGGVTMIYALFDGVNIKDGQAWSDEWYYNGQKQDNLSKSSTWDAATAGPNAVWWLTLYNDQGIRSGDWELKLYIDGNLVQNRQVTVEDNVEPDFGPISFAGGVDANDQPVNPVDVSDPTFTADTKEVYAFFNGINVPKGTDWQTEWFLNGDSVDSKDHTWNFTANEQDWIQFGSTDSTALDPGTYELKLTIGGQVVNIGSFVVSSN